MDLTLQLSTAVETKLRERAFAEGKDLAKLAEEVLETHLTEEAVESSDLSADERVALWLEWVSKQRRTGRPVDDSRESIYAGRGE